MPVSGLAGFLVEVGERPRPGRARRSRVDESISGLALGQCGYAQPPASVVSALRAPPSHAPHTIAFFFLEADALATLRRFVDASDFNAYGPNVDVRAIACRDFEVGLSVFMEANGIALHGVYSPTSMLATPAVRDVQPDASRLAIQCINPSMMLWDRMLAAGCPIVKKKRYASRHGAASDEEWVGGQKQNIDV